VRLIGLLLRVPIFELAAVALPAAAAAFQSMVFVLASGSRLRPNDALPDALLPPTHTDTVIVQCHFKMRASTAPHRKVKEAQSGDAKHIGLTG
jgi:hypothetical protein